MQIAEYIEACDYPGKLDTQSVEKNLYAYLKKIKVERKVVQLTRDWNVNNYPDILKNMEEILRDASAAKDARDAIDARDARDARAAIDARDARDAIDARDARDARAARDASAARDARAASAAIEASAAKAAIDARDARDAIDARDARAARNKFSRFMVNSYYWYSWELSWLATGWIGAIENKKEKELLWNFYLYEAFLNGCWFLYWTEETLYWFAKPICKTITQNNRKIAHCENGPAIISDWMDLYFLNGVLVNKDLVMTPAEKIDPALALTENNADVQREIIRKIGAERMLKSANAKTLDTWDDPKTRFNYKLMEMTVGQNIRRRYLYFEHASMKGVYFAKPVPPETTKAVYGYAWQRKLLTREELTNISLTKEAELIANLPAIVC